MREPDGNGRSRELVVTLPSGQKLWRVYLDAIPEVVFEWHLTEESTQFILRLNAKDLRTLEVLFSAERSAFEQAEYRSAKVKGKEGP